MSPVSPASRSASPVRPSRPAKALIRRWPESKEHATPGTAGVVVGMLVPCDGETSTDFVARLAGVLKLAADDVIMVMAYGSVAAHRPVLAQLERVAGPIAANWPLLWVEGASCQGGELAGFQIFQLQGGPIERVRLGGRVVGSVFRDGGARHCVLAGLTPANPALPRGVQCAEFFERAGEALAQAGVSYGDVARTWFYNDDILAWYDDFNRVRTAFYAKQRFRSGSLPASTAVRGRNPAGAALTFGAWAVVPETGGVDVLEVASPLQCPAPAYGSSFSRATEISCSGQKRLLVSGTASIEPGGRTIWQGDATKQIALTMDVVEAILRPRGMDFGDVVRATAYFKHAADEAIFQSWLAEHELQAMPVVPVHCDICRDDLLFEIELDACVVAET